ncbi:branched-chain amino acid transport system II carrier protein, partial [Salmonella enterica]|uniref:branched-chain amino acid transport system II carrier protein n=1 Tax=Salmonella enterica TaxID=28901 RepID=UPI000D81768C
MTHQLKSRDIIALGFMTFALFVGAGNIIFPPMVGLQAGDPTPTPAICFLISPVGLPGLIVLALGKTAGGVGNHRTPVGQMGGAPYRGGGPLVVAG